jgi:hypothetical protein
MILVNYLLELLRDFINKLFSEKILLFEKSYQKLIS